MMKTYLGQSIGQPRKTLNLNGMGCELIAEGIFLGAFQ